MSKEYRLRIDPNLVDKFLRLPGGINEVGIKIVRDLGLKFSYDKQSHSLDIIGENPDILGIAIETLRFWVEDDEFPSTGVTCQVGYPNKCMVIWRYHGDFAKKLDHLFEEEISQLKKIPTVVFKAVPTKRNPEYLEVYCHFTFFERVKSDIYNLSVEVGKLCQEDFFVPYSDCAKAKRFVRSKVRDNSVLYALKENPELNRLRVWIFGRHQSDVFRAKREWLQHVGDVTIDHDVQEKPRRDSSVKSAQFYGHLTSNSAHREYSPTTKREPNKPKTARVTTNSQHRSVFNGNKMTSNINKNNKRYPVKIPKSDHSNYPRPSDFVYPVDIKNPVIEPISEDDIQYLSNPFNQNELDTLMEDNKQINHKDVTVTKSGWEKAIYGDSKPRRNNAPPNRIYVHRQVNDQRNSNTLTEVVHPETNLMPSERYRKNKPDRLFARSTAKRNNVKTGGVYKPSGLLRQKPTSIRPKERTSNVRFHININGLDIYMYKHNIVKLDDMDAIAVPVNENIIGGGNLALNVLDMAGPQVVGEINVHRNIHGPLDVGESMVSSAGRLPFLGIIYVSSPVWENYTNVSEEDCARDLHRAIYSAMKTAERHKYRKMGLSVVGSEPYFGVPKDLVAEVHVKALVDYSMGMGPLFPVLEVHLVDSDISMLTYIKDAYDKWSTDNSIDLSQQFKSELPDQHELSERRQSAVTLKTFPSHHSENMVTFAGQSYTAEGNQMWTFDVLKRLLVHVYTGSLVKIKDVEAIVCGVSQNFKGTLAKLILNVGGPQYEEALKKARRGRNLVEGSALVCEAGSLPTDIVLHAVVGSPILKVTEKNLVRLDSLYSRVLQATHILGIHSLAMPLMATGRLREKFEVEQCGLQLIDCIIELCLSQGHSLKLRELHLVNLDPVITQSLTQALRTRAHTKLRVESDPHPPSRPEMLSFPDGPAVTNLDSTRVPVLTRSAAESDIAEEFKQLVEQQRRGGNDKFGNVEDMNTLLNGPKQLKKINVESDKENSTNINKTNNSIAREKPPNTDVPERSVTENDKQSNDKAVAPYLSKKTLQEHTWMINKQGKPNVTAEDAINASDKMKLRTPFQVQQNNKNHPHNHKDSRVRSNLKEGELNVVTKHDELKKRKRLPAIRGYVTQRSRAESYRSIYIRRQKIAEQLIKEQHVKIRRAKSTSHLHKEDRKPPILNTMTARETKQTRPFVNDMNSKAPHATQLDNSNEKHKKVVRKPAVFRDKEREDRYMKEMEMFFHEPYAPKEEPFSTDEPNQIQYRRDGSMNIIESDHFSATYRSIKSSQGRGDDVDFDINRDISFDEEKGKTNQENVSHHPKYQTPEFKQGMNFPNNSPVMTDSRDMDHLRNQSDSDKKGEATNAQHADTDQTNNQEIEINNGDDVAGDKRSKPIKLVISSEVLDENKGKPSQNIDQPSDTNKTHIPQRRKGSVELITFKNDQNSKPAEPNTITQDDVTIRDKLTLEIDVTDREPSNLTREKEKIKRFWEVVGGKDINDDKDIYGEDKVNGEKVLMTRVKKERKMSAKSKSSKQSDASNMTSKKLGKYNVTVEVV